jgi:polyisoprenoid-binding protein YceI
MIFSNCEITRLAEIIILAKTTEMKKANFFLPFLCGVVFLSSCGSDAPETDEASEPVCTYTYNEGMTSLDWTAYKTSEKVPVEGSFNDFEITAESASDPLDVAKSMSFTIETASVETNNPDRNAKISEHFFKTINTSQITGSVKSLNEDGSAVVSIKMNGVDFDVKGTYTLEDLVFSFKASIDVASWNGVSGIEALNAVCKDLHTGADGVSKLWSEVALSFSTTLKSDCN